MSKDLPLSSDVKPVGKSRRGISRGRDVPGGFAADAPIPLVAPQLFLNDAEADVLSRVMTYSRKGVLKNKIVITRQQWVEDFLTRGFTRMETLANKSLRIHNDHSGAFYDVLSQTEKGYIIRRHAALYGKPRVVESAPAETPRETGSALAEVKRQNAFSDGLRKTGVADYRGVSYKVVPVENGGAQQFQLERTFRGQREACGPILDSIEKVQGIAMAEAMRFFSDLKERARARRERAVVDQVQAANTEETKVAVASPIPAIAGQVESDSLLTEAETEAEREVNQSDGDVVTPDEVAVPSEVAVMPTPDVTFAPAAEDKGDPVAASARLAELALDDALDAHAVGRLYAGLVDADIRSHLWPALFGQGRALADNEPEIVTALRGLVGEQAWTAYLELRRNQRTVKKDAIERVTLPRFSFKRDESESLIIKGRAARVAANIAAIRLLKIVEAENRPATAEEVGVMARYSGWGGDKEIFNLQMLSEVDKRTEAYGDKWDAAATKSIAEAEAAKKRYTYSYNRRVEPVDPADEPEFLKELLAWNKTYGQTAKEVRDLLSKEEWNAALQSVLNAHYTDGELCHALWDIAVHAGFRGGRILEPAVGSGRILAAMPPELRDASRLEAVELDPISARIAAKIHPDVKVQNAAFEESSVPDGAYDLVISNVPFGKTGPGVQEGLGDVPFNLHNYFIAESMRKLKPGGLSVIITSSSTLDNNPDQRLALGKLSELRGALRLPSDAFAANAGTEVVTDILLLRKPTVDQIVPGAYIWTSEADVPLAKPYTPLVDGRPIRIPLLDVTTGKKVKVEDNWGNLQDKMVDKVFTTARIHGLFQQTPACALGDHSLEGRMYGTGGQMGSYTLLSPADAKPVAERIAAAIDLLPKDLPNPSLERWQRLQQPLAEIEQTDDETDVTIPARLEPGMVFRFGVKYYEGKFPPARGVSAVEVSDGKLVDMYIDLRDRLVELLAIDRVEPDPSARSAAARTALKDAYDACVLSEGSLSQVITRMQAMCPHEPYLQSVSALEQVRQMPAEKGRRPAREYIPAAILNKRTIFAVTAPANAGTLKEAVTQSRAMLGRLDAAYIAGQLGKDASDPSVCDAVASAVADAGYGFRAPADSERLIAADDYLSGNVVAKMEDAKRAAQSDARFLANVKALEECLPPPATWDEVRAPLGAQYVPTYLYGRFLAEVLDLRTQSRAKLSEEAMGGLVRLHGPSGRFLINIDAYIAGGGARFTNDDLSLEDLLIHAFQQTEPKIFIKKQEARIFDIAGTDVATGFVKALGTAWGEWVLSHSDAKAEILAAHNRAFSSYVSRKKTDTAHLTFPGLSSHFKPRSHQLGALADLLPNPQGVVAYNVGFGKTAIGIILAAESHRIGTAKKPMIVCDTANYLQFVQDMRNLYPAEKLLVADDANFSTSERERFKAQIAYGDHACVLVSRTQFEKIPISVETECEWIERELGELRAVQSAMGEVKENKTGKRLAREQANAIERKEQELKALMHGRKEDRGLTWEQLGVDLLIVDEAHRHKKIGIQTVHADIKGVDTGQSKRGFDLLIKLRYIQDRRGGRGGIGLTGTPCTNTMAEFHTMMKLFAPKVCEDMGIVHFDAFKSAFCEVGQELAMHEATGKWRMEQRLRKFINGRAFIAFIRAGMLVEMDSSKLALNVPKHEKGDIEFEIVPLNEQTLTAMEDIGDIYAAFEGLDRDERKELCFVPLMLMQAGMVASIDPRLIKPNEPMAPDGLIARVAHNVSAIYHDPAHHDAAQVIFLDRYGNMDTSKLDELRAPGGLSKAKGMLVLDESDEPVAGKKKKSAKTNEDEDDAADNEAESDAADAPAVRRINLYKDIKNLLIERGIPAERIVLIGDVPKKERAIIFDRVNRGEVSVIIGSSDKLGIGANFQKKLYAAHHVDPPRFMTPDQMEQRNGRLLRDGNSHAFVRVIYYGMEDTCAPAIYGRIQRKAQFIKQGYAEQGVGAEFEDVSEVRLEELKAALIPDKRAMRLAELKAELADEVRLVDSTNRRRRELISEVRTAEDAIRYLSGPGMDRATRREKWFGENVLPIPETNDPQDALKPVVLDLAGLNIPVGTGEAGEAIRAWLKAFQAEAVEPSTITQSAPLVFKGTCREIQGKLNELIELLDGIEASRGELRRNLGKIRLNGVAMALSREQILFGSSGRESLENIVTVVDPVDPVLDLVRPSRFRTAGPLFKQAKLAIFESEHDLKSMASRLADSQTRHTMMSAALAACAEPSYEKTNQLKAEIRALEADMSNKPYVRGSRLRKPVVTVTPVSPPVTILPHGGHNNPLAAKR